jgi:hypothetical protein
MVERNVVFKTHGREYIIEFPSVRQFIVIESTKIALASGQYNGMIVSSTMGSVKALDFIDMISVIQVLCPKIMTDLKMVDIGEMDLADAIRLLSDFAEQVVPWINQWMDLFKNPDSYRKSVDEQPSKTSKD